MLDDICFGKRYYKFQEFNKTIKYKRSSDIALKLEDLYDEVESEDEEAPEDE